MIITKEKYYNKHKACPECGNIIIKRYCVDIQEDPDKDFVDTNEAFCQISMYGCGWTGMVNDLKKK